MARHIEATRRQPSCDQVKVDLDDLGKLLDDLVACFNERELSRALLHAVGLELIRHLSPPGEVNARLAQWQDRWRETVRMEQLPMRDTAVAHRIVRAMEGEVASLPLTQADCWNWAGCEAL
ncbi:hypothetical protein [Roseomonas indoligenes]|uniref:Uncharacterized protein n=1 Tax=Roseomonas indoligenes TaxID=2820811 RepID=A0A940N4B3_9PROT|nr:hypothetical protein [Pararoseomonas indoligenes]MBP0496545.1 hypothetical protein [Pararoseomonas indoligenes]